MEEKQNRTPCPKDAECIYCYTDQVWFPCNVSRKLVAESGCKQIQSWLPRLCYYVLEIKNI